MYSDLFLEVTKDQDVFETYQDFIDSGKASKLSDDILDYVYDAYANDCVVGADISNYSDAIHVYNDTVDYNNEPIVFMQSLYNDPRNNTFMYIVDGQGVVREGNRCKQCSDIDIWDTDALLDAGFVCDECGKPMDSQNDFHFIIYASLECEDCAEKSQAYINSKPSGYWTS